VKANIYREHARHRAKQRYGLTLTGKDLGALAAQIRAQRARFLAKHSNTRSEWIVTHHGQPLRVIYSSSTKSIVTVLPREESPT